MVSPRKRILQTNIETRSQTPLDKVKGKAFPRAFKTYRFYLDVRKPPVSLLEDIKYLGGVSKKLLTPNRRIIDLRGVDGFKF